MSRTVPARFREHTTHPTTSTQDNSRVIIGSSIRASAIHPPIPKGIGPGIPGQSPVTATRKQPIVARFTRTDTRLLLPMASTRASIPRRHAASTITQSSVTVQSRQHRKRRTPTVCRAGCLSAGHAVTASPAGARKYVAWIWIVKHKGAQTTNVRYSATPAGSIAASCVRCRPRAILLCGSFNSPSSGASLLDTPKYPSLKHTLPIR
jgi:hypothetical protein